PLTFSSLRGCEARVWAFFRHAKAGMDSYLPYINGQSNEAMPLYIKPDRKLSVQDFKGFMRDHFEGTEFDMNTDIGSGPFHSPYRWRPMEFTVDSVTYVNERATATQQTGFSFVAQMRSWLPDPVGGILWFGVDDANTNVYVPMYCGIKDVPECYRAGNGDMLTFSWTSAFWIHNWVANMCYSKYSFMIKDIRPVQQSMEETFNKEVPVMDAKVRELYAQYPDSVRTLLTDFSVTRAQETTARWKQLGEYLLVKYMDGNVKKEKNGQFERNPYGETVYPDFPGYDEKYYRNIIKETGDKLKVTKTIHDN
ncbi:MAG: C69 family dipeptidase, partial [Bacteroidota bacterium]|nr:C69 family dipeptidase [Bacteroidota bacterium]